MSAAATVFLEKVGKALATAHPEAKTSRFSQTMTTVCLALALWLVQVLTSLVKAWHLEGVLCLEHLLGKTARKILFKYKPKVSVAP